jgi:hypothetical protein
VLVGQEHVSSPILALEPTLQSACRPRQIFEIGIVGDVDDQIDVLRAPTVPQDRADQCDASDARELSSRLHEQEGGLEQGVPNVRPALVHRTRPAVVTKLSAQRAQRPPR